LIDDWIDGAIDDDLVFCPGMDCTLDTRRRTKDFLLERTRTLDATDAIRQDTADEQETSNQKTSHCWKKHNFKEYCGRCASYM